MSSESSSEFVRGIGPWQATSLVVGTMIGSGIFIVSTGISQEMNAWGPGGLLVAPGGLLVAPGSGVGPHGGGLIGL